MHEVHAPYFVHRLGHEALSAGGRGAPAVRQFGAQAQAFGRVEPVEALVVGLEALAPQ